MTSDLSNKAKKGALSLFSGQFLKLFAQVVSLVILARLLTPEDYGLTAIVVSMVAIGEVFRDFGLSFATIQADSISQEEKSNLFWLNTSLGLLLTLILYFFASAISLSFNDSRLIGVVHSLCVIFLINGLATQFRAGLVRDLKFKQVAISDSSSAIISTCVGLAMAFLGYGYWAIVFQQLSSYLLNFLFYVYFYQWVPSLPNPKVKVERFLKFGVHLMLSQILGQLSRSTDSLIIGHQFGPTLLGIYNRAQQLVFMGLLQINAPSTNLAVPVLSKLKHDEAAFLKALNRGQSILMHVVCFIFSYFAIEADLFVNVILGSRWSETVPFIQIISFGVFFQVAEYPLYWLFLAKGLTKQQFYFTLQSRPIMIFMMLLGAIWSAYFVAIGYVFGLIAIWLLCFYTLNKIGIDIKELFLNSFTISFAYSSITVLGILLKLSLFGGTSHVLNFITFTCYQLLAVFLLYISIPRFKVGFTVLLESIEIKTIINKIFREK